MMDSTMLKIQHKLDYLIKFLKPFLPMANCHMVEFFTEQHWEKLVPKALAKEIEFIQVEKAVNSFWDIASKKNCDVSFLTHLNKFVIDARSHCIDVDKDICHNVIDLEAKIKKLGGHLEPEIHVKEFMNSKKSYEVQTMSRVVASMHSALGASVCVDAGGGRGQLPTVLALGYGVPAVTVDCDSLALEGGRRRERLIQKQWHAIANKFGDTKASSDMNDRQELHKFVNMFVTENTDLVSLVRNVFPEKSEETKLLLTGLHTCGDLGPSSLRLYTAGGACAVFNVPCCYHLLSEELTQGAAVGFPMSGYLKGFQLGRNARMLSSQSIDRYVSQRLPPPRTLLYRAVLEVIIKDHLQASNVAEGKLKRISSKCESMHEYMKAANVILKLGLDKIPERTLEEIYSEYSKKWETLVMFYLLRLCLAQVIESAILLDRLLYLKECGVEEAFLVRLFDPVLSPRCHAIVSFR